MYVCTSMCISVCRGAIYRHQQAVTQQSGDLQKASVSSRGAQLISLVQFIILRSTHFLEENESGGCFMLLVVSAEKKISPHKSIFMFNHLYLCVWLVWLA